MKKTLIIFIFSLTSITSYSQTIQSLNVSPNGTESVDVNLEIFYHQYIDYLGFDQEIIGNVINLNVCYWHSPANVSVTDNKTFNIPIDNLIDYTLNITIYRSIDLTTCDYNSITDTATLQFTTPLTETVYLGVEDFELLDNQINVYPNPGKDFVYIDNPNNIIFNSIAVYNILGEKTKTITSDFGSLDVSNLNSGMYFLEFNTDKGSFMKKIIVNN